MFIQTADILAAVEAMPAFRDASTVLAYWSLPGEVPTHGFLDRWACKKRLLLPCVRGNDLVLREYIPGRTVKGAFGILEPAGDLPEVAPCEVQFSIVPGVQFDRSGNRKGHGKGYYDRLLPSVPGPKVGVAFRDHIVDQLHPNPWDFPVDDVVTDF